MDLSFSLRMKDSSFNLGMKVIVLGSKYTGSGPSTAFLSLSEKYSKSILDIFLFWLKGEGGDCCCFDGEMECGVLTLLEGFVDASCVMKS